MEVTHVPVPEQPPPVQPRKIEPVSGAALKVIAVPVETVSVLSLPQLLRGGDAPGVVPVTVPAPVPFFATVSVTGTGAEATPHASLLYAEPPAALNARIR
jgi:hypothetical protein